MTAGAFVRILSVFSRGNDREKASGVAIFEVRDSRSSRALEILIFARLRHVLERFACGSRSHCLYRVFLFRFLTARACDQILHGPPAFFRAQTENSKFRFPADTRRNGLVRRIGWWPIGARASRRRLIERTAGWASLERLFERESERATGVVVRSHALSRRFGTARQRTGTRH